MKGLLLPDASGAVTRFEPQPARSWVEPASPIVSRIAYAAAHVVRDPLADVGPEQAVLDWDATLAFRRHLWSFGFAVAEAMDTAQRGMGLDWTAARTLIRRSVAEARAVGGVIACGAGTDHLPVDSKVSLDDVLHAYEEQCDFVQSCGGRIILMGSRALARLAQTPDEYAAIYDKVLSQVSEPVIVHWLGPMFDSALSGYWGSRDLDRACASFIDIVCSHAEKIDGVKISLLDMKREIELRARLPESVRTYTGDDCNYPELILGDGRRHSDALLGVLDPIAPAASAALKALDRGDIIGYRDMLKDTVPLARHIFAAPTHMYKSGIVFLAYLNGHQSHFRMLGGFESARSVIHLTKLFVLADRAGLLRDAEMATERMRLVLELSGVRQA